MRVGAVGNAPFQADNPSAFVNNRGGLNYEYHIGRFEVTTGQWTASLNAAYDRPASDRIPFLAPPGHWGAVSATPTTPGGLRWMVPPGNEMRPVGDISWRTAAIYCNWLHNGRAAAREAFMSGAYDVSTSGWFGNIFTDQRAHSPGARYWVPTFDELFKASHFDPDGHGPEQARWWAYNNASDSPPVYGPPGVLVHGVPAQANSGWDDRNYPGLSNTPCRSGRTRRRKARGACSTWRGARPSGPKPSPCPAPASASASSTGHTGGRTRAWPSWLIGCEQREMNRPTSPR